MQLENHTKADAHSTLCGLSFRLLSYPKPSTRGGGVRVQNCDLWKKGKLPEIHGEADEGNKTQTCIFLTRMWS